jgi:hypothetical protein
VSLILYQAYYETGQEEYLDSAFTPYDNTENKNPELREYPLWKKLYENHKGTMTYWGLLSWRWFDKTKLPPIEFKEWIESNPGYDVYHIDPFLDVSVSNTNIFVQGERWHSGMIDCCNHLFPKLGINKRVEDILYKPEHFSTCNYFIGNSNFWGKYLKFLDEVVDISQTDPAIRYYMFEDKRLYNGAMIPSFSFMIERMFSLFLYLNKTIKVKKFPVTWHNFEKIYGANHKALVNLYEQKNNQ